MYKGKPLISAQFLKKLKFGSKFLKEKNINLTSIDCVLSRNDFTQLLLHTDCPCDIEKRYQVR